jgi:hypothetical protein
MKKIVLLLLVLLTGFKQPLFSQVEREPVQKPKKEIADGTPVTATPPPPPVIREGGLYKEKNNPAVYAIQGGKKILIPSTASLWLMGYSEAQVVTVDAGRLNNYPAFIIKSKSQTPGSVVYPPEGNHIPLRGLAGATTIFSRGKEIQLMELRGWFRDIHGDCNEDSPSGYKCANKGRDVHYGFELDVDWAEQSGIDINKLLRVGNIATGMESYNSIIHPELPFNYARMVSLPAIRVELNSWGWLCRFPGVKPADWINNTDPSCPNIFWPFPPHFSDVNGNIWERGFELNNRGPYVRITGSVITDDPHDDGGWRHFLANGEWPDVVFRWGSNPKDGNHPARWTEMHPPDNIEILPFKQPRVVTRGIAFSALPNKTELLEFDIFPAKDGIPRPSFSAKVNFSEIPGAESFFPRGRNNDNGIFITKFDDHIHVRASIQGSTDLLGSSGRLKSVIKVWWENFTPAPPPAAIPGSIAGIWKGTYGMGDADAPNFYAFRINADGSMQVIDAAGNLLASGTCRFVNNQLSVTYRYTNNSTYSATGTLNTAGKLNGTWGSGTNAYGGGKWIMSKNP